MNSRPATLIDKFRERTIVIVGDLVADQFLNGTISRVSREAPVFILRHEETATLPGAAANAAANVAALGGKPILIGVVGDDANGKVLLDTLSDAGVGIDKIVVDSASSTTTKVRVLAGQHYAARQQVIRIDYDNSCAISDDVKQKLRTNLASVAEAADAIIISDYNCGVVCPDVFDDAKKIAETKKIPLVVDSRYRLPEYSNATTATPNREEVEGILGEDFTADDCEDLRRRLNYEALLVTNGNAGMTLFEKDRTPQQFDAVGPKEPVDVTGAGDTVIAAYALGLAGGLGFANSARVANHAGGLVVMKKGTAVVSLDELAQSLHSDGDARVSTQAN